MKRLIKIFTIHQHANYSVNLTFCKLKKKDPTLYIQGTLNPFMISLNLSIDATKRTSLNNIYIHNIHTCMFICYV